MRRTPLPACTLCALLALAAPARAEALDPTDFAWTLTIVASGYDGESTLESFPALVRLSESIAGFRYADIGTTTNAAYATLRFADAAENCLDYEIETWDADGTSFVWVSLPSLSGTNTSFRAYYAPVAGATLPAVHPTNVWTSAGYVGVWHMNARNGSGPKAFYPDATGTAVATHSDQSNWNGTIRDASNSTTANGTKWMVQNPPLVVSNDFTQAWTFSRTGCSLEAWRSALGPGTWVPYFTDGPSSAYRFGVGLRGDNDGSGGGVWFAGQSMTRVYPGDSSSNTWHFVTAVCPAEGAGGSSVLYGEDDFEEGRIQELLSSAAVHAVDYTEHGMGLSTVIGARSSQTWCDELRVRRGVSSPDWVQANYDSQRDGTDFLAYGAVFDARQPVVAAVARTSATILGPFLFVGGPYEGGTAKAVVVAFPSNETNEIAVANPANPSVVATGLSPDSDYAVRFVVERAGAVVFETPETAFVTAGRPSIRPHMYRNSVTFAATGYDGAETLEHFPVLVHLSEAAVPGFSYTAVDPDTIRFTSADGALLAHEIETWNPAGLSAIWVCLPSLAGTNTAFTMHLKPYDGAGVPAQPVHRVWHYAGYECVWHLNERLGDDETRYERWDERPFALYYADSSGHGRHATKGTTLGSSPGRTWPTSLAQTSPTNGPPPVSANGSPALETTIPLIVPPTVSGGMDFSASGYSAEVWFNPERGGSQGLFLTGIGVLNSTNALFADNRGVGALSCDWNMQLVPGGGTTRPTYTGVSGYTGTNTWHFLTANWSPAGAATPTAVYAGNPEVPAAFRGYNHSATAVAQDVSATGIGLTGSVGASSGGSSGRFVDELRLRRGRSSPDWIQANWDTQRVGTDFLSAGPVVDHLLPTMLLLR